MVERVLVGFPPERMRRCPWRLMAPEAAVEAVRICSDRPEHRLDAMRATEELHRRLMDLEMFAAESLAGEIFVGTHEEVKNHVERNGEWTRRSIC